MKKTFGLFFGSDTGYTEIASDRIIELIGEDLVDKHEVYDVSKNDFADYEYLILGLSTWYNGELQSDWDNFFDEFQEIDFTGKTVAIFGLGDQYGYADTFIDGVGILGKVVLENGGTLIGKWPTDSYDYDESVAELEKGVFCGLAIDEDNESDLSDDRLQQWTKQILKEFNIEHPLVA